MSAPRAAGGGGLVNRHACMHATRLQCLPPSAAANFCRDWTRKSRPACAGRLGAGQGAAKSGGRPPGLLLLCLRLQLREVICRALRMGGSAEIASLSSYSTSRSSSLIRIRADILKHRVAPKVGISGGTRVRQPGFARPDPSDLKASATREKASLSGI
jgi:hypothetical protein